MQLSVHLPTLPASLLIPLCFPTPSPSTLPLSYISSLLEASDSPDLDTAVARGWPASVHIIGKVRWSTGFPHSILLLYYERLTQGMVCLNAYHDSASLHVISCHVTSFRRCRPSSGSTPCIGPPC